MKNKTLCLLDELTYRFQRDHADRDPELRAERQRSDTLYRQFCQQYGRDRQMFRQVVDLMDTQTRIGEYLGEFRFLLGLQMGLELGGLDLLKEDWLRLGTFFQSRPSQETNARKDG